MGVVGAAIKGFGKALKVAKRNKASKQVFDHVKGKPFPASIQRHMKAADKRRAGMKKAGYKGPKHAIASSKTKGDTTTHKLKEMWSYNPYKKAKPSKVGKIIKKTAPVAAAAGAGIAYGKSKK